MSFFSCTLEALTVATSASAVRTLSDPPRAGDAEDATAAATPEAPAAAAPTLPSPLPSSSSRMVLGGLACPSRTTRMRDSRRPAAPVLNVSLLRSSPGGRPTV
eukprot:364180-Chlamydomonas_euryale.AAC.20